MDCLFHEFPQGIGIINDLHRPSPQDVGGADHDRVTDAFRRLDGFAHIHGCFIVRLFQIQQVDNLLKTLPVFCPVDGIG